MDKNLGKIKALEDLNQSITRALKSSYNLKNQYPEYDRFHKALHEYHKLLNNELNNVKYYRNQS